MSRPQYLSAKGETWTKARMRALVRDDFLCQAHQLDLIDKPCDEHRLNRLVVHHKQHRINGGGHELSNLITLCHRHHIELHPHMRFQKGRDVDLTKDGDGWDGLLEL